MKFDTGYCPICKEMRMLQKEQANHILHLILTCMTGGVWIIVWLCCSSDHKWRCCKCGAIINPESETNSKQETTKNFDSSSWFNIFVFVILGIIALLVIFATEFEKTPDTSRSQITITPKTENFEDVFKNKENRINW